MSCYLALRLLWVIILNKSCLCYSLFSAFTTYSFAYTAYNAVTSEVFIALSLMRTHLVLEQPFLQLCCHIRTKLIADRIETCRGWLWLQRCQRRVTSAWRRCWQVSLVEFLSRGQRPTVRELPVSRTRLLLNTASSSTRMATAQVGNMLVTFSQRWYDVLVKLILSCQLFSIFPLCRVFVQNIIRWKRTFLACDSIMQSALYPIARLSVCLSVCPSHLKGLKLGSCNFHPLIFVI